MTEEELVELLMLFLPETFEGWVTYAMVISAVLSYVLPKPADEAHPVVKTAHKVICVLGYGAAKVKAAGRLAKSLHGKKEGK